ncbi:hydroxypyruvate isomerase family protein [Streptomyces sp. NPDC056149]|uniref:hydroxypyruvate isomerase family protein n=1 Tax=unclassified Streptomyces TaxID=2593676 RepID=UPI002380FAE6|nr:TIM barrel protein [Streptomyces sp. WZ-12]
MTGPRFAANLTWLFTEVDFEARFEAAAAAGFAGVEYSSPYDYPAARLRRRLADAGLTQVLLNSPKGSPGSPARAGLACIPGLEAEFRAGIERGLAYADALGCGLLHVVGGIVPQGVGRDRAFARYVTNLAWAAERAAGTGVRLVVEAQNGRDAPGFVLNSQAQAAAVVEAVGADHLGLLLDFYHLQVAEGDLVRTYRRLADRVFHLQIADPPCRHEPGTGEICWRAVFRAVRDSGYDGWIGCEYAPLAGTVPGLGWMSAVAE